MGLHKHLRQVDQGRCHRTADVVDEQRRASGLRHAETLRSEAARSPVGGVLRLVQAEDRPLSVLGHGVQHPWTDAGRTHASQCCCAVLGPVCIGFQSNSSPVRLLGCSAIWLSAPRRARSGGVVVHLDTSTSETARHGHTAREAAPDGFANLDLTTSLKSPQQTSLWCVLHDMTADLGLRQVFVHSSRVLDSFSSEIGLVKYPSMPSDKARFCDSSSTSADNAMMGVRA